MLYKRVEIGAFYSKHGAVRVRRGPIRGKMSIVHLYWVGGLGPPPSYLYDGLGRNNFRIMFSMSIFRQELSHATVLA